MVVGRTGGFRHHAVLLVVMECKYIHGPVQIPRQNLAEDLVKELREGQNRVLRMLVRVSKYYIKAHLADITCLKEPRVV